METAEYRYEIADDDAGPIQTGGVVLNVGGNPIEMKGQNALSVV
jgi:hypothetical protein